jgi:hypothetical protein
MKQLHLTVSVTDGDDDVAELNNPRAKLIPSKRRPQKKQIEAQKPKRTTVKHDDVDGGDDNHKRKVKVKGESADEEEEEEEAEEEEEETRRNTAQRQPTRVVNMTIRRIGKVREVNARIRARISSLFILNNIESKLHPPTFQSRGTHRAQIKRSGTVVRQGHCVFGM